MDAEPGLGVGLVNARKRAPRRGGLELTDKVLAMLAVLAAVGAGAGAGAGAAANYSMIRNPFFVGSRASHVKSTGSRVQRP